MAARAGSVARVTENDSPLVSPGTSLVEGGRGDTDLEQAIEVLLNGRTIEEVDQDPELRHQFCRGLGQLSPAGLALVTSRGKWQLARHHAVLDGALMRAIVKPEGRLIVSVSVRAGKSVQAARYTSAWYLGRNPDHHVILGAHEAGFAAGHSGYARDVLDEYGPTVFGVGVDPTSNARNRWEIADHAGGMFAVGVGGSPIGRGANLMVIDDPIKSYEAAMSDVQRDKVNEWYQGTMSSRIEPGGSVIVICSRWHEEDLSGFLMTNFPGDWEEVHIPAICDRPDEDALGRAEGESFWPERWPVDLLRRREREVGPMVWLAQYQQRPTRPVGGIFPVGKLNPVEMVDEETGIPFDYSRIVQWCRGWDLAATEDDGDFTVGVLLGRYDDGRWLIADIVRGQWGEGKVRTRIAETKAADEARFGQAVLIELPQDPGQAGKSQVAQLGAMLSGSMVEARPQTGSKALRAAGIAAQVQMENVDYIAGQDWGPDMLNELRSFDQGTHDDIVDALASAFNRMVESVRAENPVMSGIAAFTGLTRSTRLG